MCSEEYARAHALNPTDPLGTLCFATSLLSLAFCRMTSQKRLCIAKAFGVLNKYAQQRSGPEVDTSCSKKLVNLTINHTKVFA